MNNACCALSSQQRVRASSPMGDTCHQAPENKLSRMDVGELVKVRNTWYISNIYAEKGY